MFEGCKYGEWMGVVFATAKLLMYFVFIWRLYIVYTDSMFAYNTCIIIAMTIMIILWIYANAFFNVYTTKNDVLISNGNTYCTIMMYFPMVVSTVFCDMIVCFLLCYLFIRPLLKLNDMNNNQNKMTMTGLIVKYTLLTFVAVVSTFITFIAVGMTGLAGLVAIDVV
eukprot:UN06307